MTTRIAFFVEGMTERIVIERLLREYYGAGNIHLTVFILRAVDAGWRSRAVIYSDGMEHAPVRILLYDCSNDERVVTEMRERGAALADQGFDVVIGVRDLHPAELNEEGDVRQRASRAIGSMPTLRCRVEVVLCVHESECMFLADPQCLERISSSITPALLEDVLGAGWATRSTDIIERPSAKIGRLFGSIGLVYDKKEASVRMLAKAMDPFALYYEYQWRCSCLRVLFTLLDATPWGHEN